MKEVYNFVDFANMSHPSIKFTCEMSSKCAVFLDTEVFKGPRLSTHQILDLTTHFKPAYTLLILPPFKLKGGQRNKNETLNTDSVKEATL